MTKESRKSNANNDTEKEERKKTALNKMNRELFEVHVRNAIQLEHKQQHNTTDKRTNVRTNEQPDYHTIE